MKKQKYPYNSRQQTPSNKQTTEKPFRWIVFSAKIVLLLIAVVAAVLYTDKKEYFRADQSNNHIDRKTKSFYKFTKTKNIDVLLLGNSHIVTGVDPFVLSAATSSNCFIFAQSGVDIMDCWYHLCEALRYTNPKLVIVETYTINRNEKDGVIPLTQSFEAHRNGFYKLRAMPAMFSSDNWVQAWSPTIRNHSFLLTDTARIKYNIRNPQLGTNNNLDLGRFARFDSGLEDSLIAKYDSLGAPIKGGEYLVSKHCKKYLKRIMKLCQERNIPVLFLTVPMYYKHIDNYTAWKNTLNEELKKYPTAQWLDLQEPYDSLIYTAEAFENTYESNQHLSNLGMVYTAYKLADYLKKHYQLPDRSKDSVWISDFKGTDHFIFNQDIVEGIGCTSVVKDTLVGNFHVRELLIRESETSNQVILKIDNAPELASTLNVVLRVEYNKQQFLIPINLHSFKEVSPPHYKVYAANLVKEVKVVGISKIQ